MSNLPISSSLVVIGSMNMDLILRVPTIPKPGETVLAGEMIRMAGGKGGNQAVAAARLGADVALIAAVGADHYGEVLKSTASQYGVDARFVRSVEDIPTGLAFISVTGSGENSIVVAPGANLSLGTEEIESSLSKLPDLRTILASLEIPIPSVERAFSIARARDVKTILNLSPVTPSALTLIPLCDFLIVNQHEVKEITGFGVDDLVNLRKSALSLSISELVVTLGSAGAIHIPIMEEIGNEKHVSAPIVQTIDSTGCGDAFAGAFACELSTGKSAASALRIAVLAGSYAATCYGAQTSYGSRSQILELT